MSYYNRQGQPISLQEWAGALEKRLENRIVAQTILKNGRWVSTVWLGLDHSFGGGPPLIFETMVFPNENDRGELDCERYSTEQEALAGHEAMMAKWAEAK